MAARTTTSCISLVKEPVRNPKAVLSPLLFLAVLAITAVEQVYINPLTAEMALRITQMKKDPSSAEYAGLLEEVRQEASELLLIFIAIALVLLTAAFANEIVAWFSGDRYSHTEILREVVKHVKGPLIVTAAVVTMVQATSMALLGAYIDTVSESDENFSVFLALSLVALAVVVYEAFLFLGVVAVVIVAAASVVGEGWRGVRGLWLREAWRLITQTRIEEGYVPVLVLMTLLLPTVLTPLYAVALLYTKQSTGLGLCLLSDYYSSKNLLTGVYNMYYLTAACMYSSRGYYSQAMESKEVASDDDYAQIPSHEHQVAVVVN